MRNKAINKDPCLLAVAPDHFKTQDMCNKTTQKDPRSLMNVPEHLKHKACVVLK